MFKFIDFFVDNLLLIYSLCLYILMIISFCLYLAYNEFMLC
jgi:hypothetical protein